MSLAGRLEDIDLAEVLHFLALNNRTGRLSLYRRDANGTVVIRAGRVIYAVSSSIRETLGSLLVCRRLVTPEALATTLERQHATADGRRLGALLVEDGLLSEAQLQDALRQQTALVVQELCRWRGGYFRFEIGPVASSGDIGVDVEDLVVTAGVATDQILLEAMAQLDEATPAEEPLAAPRDVVAGSRAPVLRGEVSAGLLRRAGSVVRRGVLMVVRGDEAQSIAHVGVERTDPAGSATALCLSLCEPSVIADAVERRRTWRGQLPPGAPHETLLAWLGGVAPQEAVVVPLMLHDRTGLVLYGDDGGDGAPLGDASDLEWALLEAGLAMERDVLEQRLRDFERVRGYRP